MLNDQNAHAYTEIAIPRGTWTKGGKYLTPHPQEHDREQTKGVLQFLNSFDVFYLLSVCLSVWGVLDP